MYGINPLFNRLGFFLLASLLLSPVIMAADQSASEPDRIAVFKTVDAIDLTLHVFQPPGGKASGDLPGIVLFYGGGWIGGDIFQFYPHAQYLASRGMVAMVAEYRVKDKHGTSPRECVMDGKSAIRWIRTHARELGVDSDRLVAGGGSAGGHVAAAAATVPGLNQPGEDTGVSCAPDALVLFNPVFDNGPDGFGYDRVEDYWREISPAHNISAATPPAAVFLGTEDVLVPVMTAERFQARMQESGVRCDLHLYEGESHGFFNRDRGASYFLTLAEADRFLASLGYLEGDPTLAPPSSQEGSP